MSTLPSAARGAPSQVGSSAYANALEAAGGQLVGERLRPSDCSSVGVALYTSPPYDLEVPALPVSRLSITLTASRVSGGLQGEREQVFDASRHALFLAPAGAGARWKKALPSRHLTLYFDARTLADAGAGSSPVFDGMPLHNASVPGVGALADELRAELEAGAAWSAEATDSLGRLLLIKVARHCSRQRTGRNPISTQILKRLNDHVQAHLAERILVSDLAAVAGLSPNHFAHAYTACTGHSPHQFVMAQRLQRAQALLREASLPLAQVAAACGFANQQHLTQVMRKRLGATPGQFRRNPTEGGGTPADAA